MIKVKKRDPNKIAIFYKDLKNKKIQKLIFDSSGWVKSGYINGQETLFIKTGEYKISGSVKENKYTSVAANNWLVIDAIMNSNGLLIDKIKVVNPEKFEDMYKIIDNEADLFSELEGDEEDKSIKFEQIKRKRLEYGTQF